MTGKDDGLEGQAHIACTKLSGKARGPVGIVALLLALNIVAIGVRAYLTTVMEESRVVAYAVGVLSVTAGQLVYTIRNLLS